jgi:hypothetical protein
MSAKDVSLQTGTNKGRAPGVYRDVTLEPHASLTLEPGEYDFRSLRMKSDSRLYFTGPAKVRILYGIHADNGSYLGTAPGLSVAPNDIVVYVQGTDELSAGYTAVDFSPKSFVLGALYAPNGTIRLNQQTQAAGALFGRDVVLGQEVTLRLASGFGVIAKSAVAEELASKTEDESVPTTYVLSQNYPNPFNPTTQIKYGLPRATSVNLTVFNMLGQEIARLVDEVQPEGYYVVQWNGRNQTGATVSSGMYIYQLRAGDFVQTRKMMLIK